MDPRVERTREHVLSCARTLLAESGADAVTFSNVGKRARVARQTLYRHWATREQLIADVLVAASDLGRETPAERTPEAHLRAFLYDFRARMAGPAIASATTLLMAHATTDPGSALTLRTMVDDRMAALRTGWGQFTEDEYALIMGPCVFQLLVLRRPLTDEFIESVIAEAITRRGAVFVPQSNSSPAVGSHPPGSNRLGVGHGSRAVGHTGAGGTD
ncbi:DNA-binding transcriptional regulator, AcrR family [Nakamurella panacisegetis]|uniref:DNA-binding transcriptional regulator, AcrR family n=1 Tax=Nakamurella panacisegetis TaxID=1090615 RepID=A0A1H0KQL8_9ACTN|nr:TetR/AcrR family transcriptional regulator [Nakamurella panacisegetis]SDO58063.1 DNA-binding transcriptional regulator, AcrR family [Nakamurella panacisegetis]